MLKTILSLLLLSPASQAGGQYLYKGQVFSVQREVTALGEIYLKTEKAPRNLPGETLLTKTDTAGRFKFWLSDTSNVHIVFKSFPDGSASQRLFYEDSVNRIFIDSLNCKGKLNSNEEKAQNDIATGNVRLLCFPGYATNHLSKADSAFERKYNVRYKTMADEPEDKDCVWLYNKTVSAYLDIKYGEGWREQVRTDVLLPYTKNASNPIYKNISGLQQIDSIQWCHLQDGYYKSISRFYTKGFRFNKNGTFSITNSDCVSSSQEEAGYWYIRDNSDLVLQYPTHTSHFDVLKFERHIFLIEQGERVKFIRDLDDELKQERFLNRGKELKEIDERYTPQFFTGWHLLSKYYGYEQWQ